MTAHAKAELDVPAGAVASVSASEMEFLAASHGMVIVGPPIRG
jgi:hypothetical protein